MGWGLFNPTKRDGRTRRPRCGGALGVLGVLCSVAAGNVWAQQPARSAPPHAKPAAAVAQADRSLSYTFVFKDAAVSDVAAEILGKALGLTYTVDPEVTGKMSFQIDKKLTEAQLLESFEVVLEQGDASLVREGDTLVIKPRDKARLSSKLRNLSDGISAAGFQTVAVPVDFAQASEIAKALQSVGSKDLILLEDDKLALLVLGGSQSELESAIETIHLFDNASFQDAKIRFFDLQQASAFDLAADLNRLIQASNIAGVTAVPLKRLNAIFLIAQSPTALSKVAEWIRKLDVPSHEKTLSIWVYHPRNLTADALAAALNSIISGSSSAGGAVFTPAAGGGANAQTAFAQATPTTSVSASSFGAPKTVSTGTPLAAGGPLPVGGGQANTGTNSATAISSDDDPVRVGADRQSNTLIVSASQAHWVQIQKTLDELDRTPSQVLIEARILEVTLSDQLSSGVDWQVLGASGRLTASNINSVADKVQQAIPGLSVTFLEKDIQAAVSALSAKTTVDVISAPKVLAVDNHEAKLSVGDDVPITTQSAQSVVGTGSPILNSVSYRTTGVILSVTPRIGGDRRITLDIEQEISNVAKTTSSTIDSPTIQERKVQTTMVVGDGGVVALGGLISSNRSTTDNGIPYLQSIPGAGNLFKTRSRSLDRTELIVLIKANIIPDNAAAERSTAALVADMQDLKTHGLLEH